MRIGILGGTFNPIHNTHLTIARSAREQLALDRVLFVPAKTPPHKLAQTTLAPPERRLRMVELAIAGIDGFEVSDVELRRHGPSYTVDTLTRLKQDLGPDTELFFIVGSDQVLELATWHRADKLVQLCQLVAVERPGFPLADLERLADRLPEALINSLRTHVLHLPTSDVSATDIRKRLAAGQDVTGLLPKPVLGYINEHGLYR